MVNLQNFSCKKKYIQMATYGFVGLSLYLFVKRNPEGSRSIFKHANDIVCYMPIDRNTTDMLTPIFNFKVVNKVILLQSIYTK